VTRVWPPALRPGDLVVGVAPSGSADPDRIAAGVALAESWGLRVRLAPHVFSGHDRLGYLAASDTERAADFEQAWCDPEVRAVWAVRGGYGSQRMVDLLDWTVIRAAGAKHLIGFSDITALHTRLGRELDLVTVHGPGLAAVTQLTGAASVEALRALLLEPSRPGRTLVSGRGLVPGVSRGLLVGGNVSLLAADLGIEPAPGEPAIAVLEEVGEPAYRIDRMLTQLLRSGWFAGVTGVVVGDLGLPDDTLVLDRLGPLGVPLAAGVEVGHGARNLALPLGSDVRLEVGRTTAALRLLPSSCQAHSSP
jgi:muramoyltetrapeptide carboxypeptidase